MKERATRQLAAVYAVVCAAQDHPTAEEVHARVRRHLPRISLGTVYRNLQKLAAQQRIRVVHLPDRVTRYDGMCSEHDHFGCEQCGAVTDVPRAPQRPAAVVLAPLALGRSGHVVRRHMLTLYGLCPRCRAGAARRVRRGRASDAAGSATMPNIGT